MSGQPLGASRQRLRFAREPDFARQCEDAGLHDVYLQFDGVTDDIYRRTRGRPLMDEKMRAVDRIMDTDMKIVLVPTIVRGFNDHQVGQIVQFALDRIETISGISFQPVAFTGRISRQERLSHATKSEQAAAMLVVTSLQKRLLSSIEAFARTLALGELFDA